MSPQRAVGPADSGPTIPGDPVVPFLPGAELARRFHEEVVAPAVGDAPCAAGLLGAGSEVLGYDTERSTDHDWAPSAVVLVRAADVETVRARLEAAVPERFAGWSTRAGRDGGPLHHRVVVDEARGWLTGHLGVDPLEPLSTLDWLCLPQQLLLGVTAGLVFRDDLGDLSRARSVLAAFPPGVRWWLLACQWRRVAQAEPLVQRTAEVGDDLGSAVVAAGLVRDLVRLALLQAGRYAPYDKWLGTAFAGLDHPDGLDVELAAVLGAQDAATREQHLVTATSLLAVRHAALPGAAALDAAPRPFHDRPALVLDADRFVADCLRHVDDPLLASLPLVGSVDQLVASTDLLVGADLVRRARVLYSALAG